MGFERTTFRYNINDRITVALRLKMYNLFVTSDTGNLGATSLHRKSSTLITFLCGTFPATSLSYHTVNSKQINI